MYKINWDQIGGFFDGEGYVGAGIKKTSDYNIGYEFSPNYKIGQTGKMGSEILKEIQIFLKNNGIKSNYKEEPETRNNWSDKSYLSIEAQSEVKKFTSEIKKHTRIKEPQIKIMEEKILPIMKRNGHLKKNTFIKIVYWKEKLDSYKGGNNRSKYNVEYFENEWNIDFNADKCNVGGGFEFSERGCGSVFDY